MGIVMIPDMGSNQLSITVDVADDTAKDDAFATADAVMDAVSALGRRTDRGCHVRGGNSMVSMMGSDAAVDNTTFTYYVLLTDEGACRGAKFKNRSPMPPPSCPAK